MINFSLWHVQVEDKSSGYITHWIADVFSQCVGSLDRPKFGNTPGREKFKGDSWHTAHWRHDYDLTGLKVGVIGCGPSVAQIIPEIVDKVGHMTVSNRPAELNHNTDGPQVYMRTPPVCVARNDFRYSGLFRWAVRWVPGFVWLARQRMNVRMMRFGKRAATDNSPENDLMTKTAIDFMEKQIQDPKLREIVRPHSKCMPSTVSSSRVPVTNTFQTTVNDHFGWTTSTPRWPRVTVP
jgi:cation diffusion facilitator CzcD-associated flavoprotein CzcO